MFRRAFGGRPTSHQASSQADAEGVRLPDIAQRNASAPATPNEPPRSGRATPLFVAPREEEGAQHAAATVGPPAPAGDADDEAEAQPAPNTSVERRALEASNQVLGLANVGNTCYLNATIQLLASVPVFAVWANARAKVGSVHKSGRRPEPPRSIHRALFPRNGAENTRVAKQAYSSFTEACACIISRIVAATPAEGKNPRVLEPSRFIVASNERLPVFSGNDQHDIMEYMLAVLDALDEDESKELSQAPAKSGAVRQQECDGAGKENNAPNVEKMILSPRRRNNGNKSNTFFRRNFCGTFCTSSTCLACQRTAETREPFWVLSAPIGRPTEDVPPPPPKTTLAYTPAPPAQPPPRRGQASSPRWPRRRSLTPAPGGETPPPEPTAVPAPPSTTRSSPAPSPMQTRTVRPARRSDPITLEDCIGTLLQPEYLTGENAPRCEFCESREGRKRTMAIAQHPPVLIVHLKRFHYELSDNPNQGYVPKRIDSDVSIPHELHLPSAAQLAAPSKPASSSGRLIFGLFGSGNERLSPARPVVAPSSSPNVTYELRGVAHHEGSMFGGHYYADCLDLGDAMWYRKDDETVLPMSKLPYHDGKNDNRPGSKTAYVLVYMRKESA